MEKTLPSSTKVVVIGGGVAGCSVAYHLAKFGWKDTILLERDQLTSGTTWHAAGLVGQLGATATITKLRKYSLNLYKDLEKKTELSTGLKQNGAITIASTKERFQELLRQATSAQLFDVNVEVLDKQKVKDLYPVINDQDILGGDNPEDTELKLSLAGRNPDEGMTAIAYDKGYFFLRLMEEKLGRERFDKFLKDYFTAHSFQVMDTERFIDYLMANLLSEEEAGELDIQSWIYGKGLPANMPKIDSDKMMKVDALAASMVHDSEVSDIPWEEWKYQEKVRFLSQLPEALKAPFMAKLDAAFDITNIGNNEVLFEWLEQSIYRDYEASFNRADKFLVSIGRRKFLTPLYKAFKETGRVNLAREIYKKARPNYHSVAIETMDDLLTK